jgi:type I restriction enzyme, S subunit
MPDTLKKGWRSWRFDQMAYMVNDRIDDPSEANVEHYVGLEHLDSDSLTIRRWGSPSDVEATKLCFCKGDIIFGRRRVYQRKLAVAPFDGICSAHAMVLRPKTDVALPEFLPFFMQSDLFMERAKQISVGSLSPTINWKTLAAEEFALPPLDEQRRIAEVLGASQECIEALMKAKACAVNIRESYSVSLWGASEKPTAIKSLSEVCLKIQDGTHFSPKSSVGEYRYVTSKNIRDGYFDLSDAGWISKQEHDGIYKRCDVRDGDVLLTKDGANAGNVAINNSKEPFSLLSSVAFIRPNPDVLLGRYAFEYMRSRFGRGRILSHVKGSAITRLVLAQIRALEVPVPPLSIQENCCRHFDSLGRAIDFAERRGVAISKIRKRVMLELEAAI